MTVLTMGQDDCSTSTTDSPDKDSGSEGSKQPRSKVGDSITLEGTDTKVKVKLLGVDRNPAGEFDEAQRGRRFVGVRIRLTNMGNAAYDDSPSNGAKLITNKDEQAEATILSGGCGTSFASDTSISPGASQQGCVPFEIKKKAKPKTFQFSLDSGFGPQTGEWSVK